MLFYACKYAVDEILKSNNNTRKFPIMDNSLSSVSDISNLSSFDNVHCIVENISSRQFSNSDSNLPGLSKVSLPRDILVLLIIPRVIISVKKVMKVLLTKIS